MNRLVNLFFEWESLRVQYECSSQLILDIVCVVQLYLCIRKYFAMLE